MLLIQDTGEEAALEEVTAYLHLVIIILRILHVGIFEYLPQGIFTLGNRHKVHMIGHKTVS